MPAQPHGRRAFVRSSAPGGDTVSTNRHRNRRLMREHASRLKAQRRQPCVICQGRRGPINYNAEHDHPLAFSLEHLKPVHTHPHLEFEPTNHAASHLSCNVAQGARIRNGRATESDLRSRLGDTSRAW